MTFEIQNEIATHQSTYEEKLMLYGYGEWVEEPDNIEFTYRDIQCQIARNMTGSLCGYIVIPKTHPWASRDNIEHWQSNPEDTAEVHGGITLSEPCAIDPDLWVIGFDCAHGGDIRPLALKTLDLPNEIRDNMEPERLSAYEKAKIIFEGLNILLAQTQHQEQTYKNIDYVKKEIMKLVDQSLLISSTNGEIK